MMIEWHRQMNRKRKRDQNEWGVQLILGECQSQISDDVLDNVTLKRMYAYFHVNFNESR